MKGSISTIRPCARCGVEFEQARVRGRPWAYCGSKCRAIGRATDNAERKRLLYQAMRAAGVPPKVALKACNSKARTAEEIRKAQELACSG